MPTPTYVPLATITLTATDSEIIFSSIPATYRDLILIVYAPASSGQIAINPNGSSSDLSQVRAYNVGGTRYSNTATSWNDPSSGEETRFFTYQILDYSDTSKHKTALWRQNYGTEIVIMGAGRWANTDAISSLTLIKGVDNFAIGSTLSLYGVN